MTRPPSIEEKLLAVIRAARKLLRPSVEHQVGLSTETVVELDKLLNAGEGELLANGNGVKPSSRMAVEDTA